MGSDEDIGMEDERGKKWSEDMRSDGSIEIGGNKGIE